MAMLRSRLAAMRAATAAIRHALVQFYETLDGAEGAVCGDEWRGAPPSLVSRPSEGAARKVVGIRRGVISSNLKLSDQAARSIG
jgi:hypothetical protein